MSRRRHVHSRYFRLLLKSNLIELDSSSSPEKEKMTGIRKRILEISGYIGIRVTELQQDGSGDLQIGAHIVPFILIQQYMGKAESGYLDGTVRRVSIRHLWSGPATQHGDSRDEKFSILSDNFQICISIKEKDVSKFFLAICCECLEIETILAGI